MGDFMQDKNISLCEVSSVYNSVKELYLSYCEELSKEKMNLEFISNDIKEVTDYISYLNEHQKSDAFVFSPRGVISKNSGSDQESIFDTGKVINFSDTQKKKDELACLEENKRICEEKIKELDSTIAILENNKNILKQVEALHDSFEVEKKNLQNEIKKCNEFANSINNGTLEKLSYISHMAGMIENFIDHDPMRAKLELKNLKDNVQSVLDNLEQLVKVPEGDTSVHTRRDN